MPSQDLGLSKDGPRISSGTALAIQELKMSDMALAIQGLNQGSIDFGLLERIAPQIKAAGYDSYVDYEYSDRPSTGIAVLDAKNIRSVNAEFDPEKTNSGEILSSQRLSMSDEARLERAVLMGFNVHKTWYHGTKRKFSRFDPAAERANRGTNVEGSYFTNDRSEAETYGETGGYFIRPKNIASSESVMPTPEMVEEYTQALYREWNNDDWSREVLAPDYAETGKMKANMTGESKRKVLAAGGYDAVMDGEHIVIFNPSDIRSVDAAFDPEKSGSSEILDSRRERVGTTGQYVGAPKGIDTPSKLATMLRKVKSLTAEGEYGRFWYERSSRQILDMVNGDMSEAAILAQAIAITSQGTKVGQNFNYALQAYVQHKAGEPIKTGRFPTEMSKKLTRIFNGHPWEGRKTNSFHENLMVEIDPSYKSDLVTQDLWMMRAYGYMGDGPAPRQYDFAENETQKIAKKLGWTPHQVQAAIWVAMKSRMENPEVKKRTEEISERRGWIKYNVNSKGKKVRVVLDSQKHRKNWFNQAMKHTPTEKDKSQAKFDYKDAADTSVAQISWESRPGETSNHMPEAFDASQGELLDYHRAISSAFLDNDGNDIVATELGLASPNDFEAPGYFKGRTSPSTQTEVIAPSQYGTSPSTGQFETEGAATKLINMYAAVRGILLKQDAVGWHKPFFSPSLSKAKANAVEIRIGRKLSVRETAGIAESMARISGTTGFNPIASPTGVRLINFDYLGIDNKAFQGMVESTMSEMQFDNNEASEVELFAADTGYLKNDWTESKNGEGYLQDGSGGQPDLQRRISDLVTQIKPRIDAVEEEYSERYGWTRNPEILFSRRGDGLTESEVRPSGGRNTGRTTQGIILRTKRPAAQSVSGVHYGKSQAAELGAAMYGTGIRGAEAGRIASSEDPRIANRVYFYIERPSSQGLMRPEGGLGQHVYSQKFNNILVAPSAMNRELVARVKRATGFASGSPEFMNAYESAVINAGYDGYAVPQNGMMVVLDNDTPVNYLGTRQALTAQGVGYTDMLDVDPVTPPNYIAPTTLDPAKVEQAVEDNKLDVESTPRSGIPYMGTTASPEAQFIARNPEHGVKPDPKIKEMYSKRTADVSSPELDRIIAATTAAPTKGPLPYETYVEATGETKTQFWLTKFRQAAIQRYAKLEKLNYTPELRGHLADTSSIAATLFADRSRGVVAAAIKSGVVVYKDGLTKVQRLIYNEKTGEYSARDIDSLEIGPNEVEFKGLIDVMKQLHHAEFGNLTLVAQTYAISQRSKRLDNEQKEVPISESDRAALDAQIDLKYGEGRSNPIRKWYRDWQAYNNYTIDFMRDTGVLTDETATLWRDMSDYYPFYRAAEGEGEYLPAAQKVFGNLTGATAISELKGSEAAINLDMIEAVSLNLTAAIDMGMKNVAQQRIVRDLVQLGLAKEAVKGGRPTAPVVKFRVQGKTREFEVYDLLVYESMQSLDGDSFVSMVQKTAGRASGLLRETITKDPGFMAVNMLRDTLSAWVTSGSNFVPVIGTLKGWSEDIERLEAYGVVGGYDYSNDPDDLVKYWDAEMKRREKTGTQLNMFKTVWDYLGHQTTRSDAATRNAVYNDVLARTGNEAEAAYQAMEVINFSRRGSSVLARVLTTSIPFLNARFQGLDVMLRSFSGDYSANSDLSKNRVRISALTRGAVLASLTAMYWMLVSDDDQYKGQTDYTRDNNWIIPTAWGVPAKLPIPFEVGLLFKTLPETIIDVTFGDKTKREAGETAWQGITSTLEINPLGIQITAPLVEAALNKSFHTGREIVPYFVSHNTVAGLQERVNTNELARDIGHALNISPMKVEHVMRGYTGTLGAYVWDVVDVGLRKAKGDPKNVMASTPWYQYPLIKRFFASKNGQGLKEDAYDLHFALNKITGTIKSLQDDGRIAEASAFMAGREHLLALKGPSNSVKEVLDNLRKQKERVQRSSMDASMKRQMTDDLDRQTNLMLRVQVPAMKAAADLPVDFPGLNPLYN